MKGDSTHTCIHSVSCSSLCTLGRSCQAKVKAIFKTGSAGDVWTVCPLAASIHSVVQTLKQQQMENSLERERRSKYDLIETADISYGHNKLLSYAICSLDCENCNNYITIAYLPLRQKEEISCFNHFYKTQKHPAQTLWLPLPQYFSSTCLIRLPLWLTATFKEKKKNNQERKYSIFSNA